MDESTCPVSGLPVISKPEWSDLKLDTDYYVSFKKIGDNILLHLPYGDMKQFNSNRFYELRETVIRSAFPADQKIIDLKSYKNLINGPTAKERKNVYKRLYEEKGRSIGFIVYDLSPVIRFMYQAAFDLTKNMPFLCRAVDDYQSAMRLAMDILGLSHLETTNLISEGFHQNDDWVYRKNGTTIEFMISYDNILYCSFCGIVRGDCLSFIDKTLSDIFGNNMISGDYYYIVNYEHTFHIDKTFKKPYIDAINKLHKTYDLRIISSFICGANETSSSIHLFSERLKDARFQFVQTVDNALHLIRNPLDASSGTDAEVKVSPQDIENLISFIGKVAWDSDDIPDVKFSPSSPLKRVADVLTVIKQDRKDLITELENRNCILKQIVSDLKVARDKAEAANIAKSQFLASMSHELRTPLNGVIGLTDILINSELNEEQRSCVSILQQSGKHLLTIINDILDYSKIESGKLTLEKNSFDLLSVIENMIEMVANQAYKKNLTLNVDIEDGVYPLLVGDSHRLGQILVNLLGNAIKFTNAGEVKCSIRVIADQNNKIDLMFEIEDTGIGISSEKIPLLFKQFTQADSSMTRKYGGTGLGLSISKKLVELCNGTIGVRSTFGKGSTFWFVIPFEKQSGVSLPGDKICSKEYPFVILAENELERFWYAKLVKSINCVVTYYGSVEDCTSSTLTNESIQQEILNIVIDISYMPANNPESLLSKISEQYKGFDLRFFIITIPSVRSRYECVTGKYTVTLISKPVFPHRLKSLIVTILENESCTGSKSEISYSNLPVSNPIAHSASPGCPGKILLVEDVATNQLIAKRLLEKCGFSNIKICNNGREAIEVLKTQEFDLVLMDCQMPEMDGYTTTEIIRDISSDVKNHMVTVIAVTAHALKTEIDRCYRAGMNDFLLKPFTLVDLKQMLVKWGLMDS